MNVDFQDHLRRQLRFLQASSDAYDAGDRDESYRIATAIRILLHDTAMSTSLLTHLGRKDAPLLSTTNPASDRTLLYDGMSVIRIGDGMSLGPALDKAAAVKRVVRAEDWWQEVIFVENDVRINRRFIVLKAANEDGGAHVDSKLTAEYAYLKQRSLTFESGESCATYDIPERQLVFLRQMAYELLNSPALHDLAETGSVHPEHEALNTAVQGGFVPPPIEEATLNGMNADEVERLRCVVRYGHYTLLSNLYNSSPGGATRPEGNYEIDKRKGFGGSLDEWLHPLLREGLIEPAEHPGLYRGTMKGRAFVARIIEAGG